MIRVIARATAKAGEEKRLLEVIHELAAASRKEPGCGRYEVIRGSENPAEIATIEEWASDAAVDEHMRTDHVLKALGMVGPLVSGAPEIKRFNLMG